MKMELLPQNLRWALPTSWKLISDFDTLSPRQTGKDVITFLTWAAEPEMEERKLVLEHFILVLTE